MTSLLDKLMKAEEVKTSHSNIKSKLIPNHLLLLIQLCRISFNSSTKESATWRCLRAGLASTSTYSFSCSTRSSTENKKPRQQPHAHAELDDANFIDQQQHALIRWCCCCCRSLHLFLTRFFFLYCWSQQQQQQHSITAAAYFKSILSKAISF